MALALRRNRGLADDHDRKLVRQLQRLPLAIDQALSIDDDLMNHATELLTGAPDSLYLGRGLLYPIALEGALKLKEISYLHAEGYPAGEMKHGPIALLTDGFPVVAVAPATATREKLLGNVQEVRARGAAVIAVAEAGAEDVEQVADLVLPIPEVHPLAAAHRRGHPPADARLPRRRRARPGRGSTPQPGQERDRGVAA